MKKYKSVLLPLAIFMLLSGCAANAQVQDIPVKTAVADKMQIESAIDIAGVFSPYSSENVNTKMAGIVKEINVKVGQYVSVGDTLIVLDTKDLEAQLAQAQATYNAAKDQAGIAKSNLDAARTGAAAASNSLNATKASISDQILQAETNLDAAQKALDAVIVQNNVQLEQARSNVDTAQKNYDRVQQLFASSIVSQVDMENAEKSLDTVKTQLNLVETSTNSALLAAESKLDAAKIAYTQANGSGANSQVVAAQGNVTSAQGKIDTAKKQYDASSSSALEQAQAAVHTIETQLSNAVIQAHINGVVVNKNVNVGELAQPGSPLIAIADTGILKLNGTISQETIPYVQVGQHVDVFADIFPDNALKGTVESVGPISVSTGSYFPIEISVDNTDKSLMAGVSAHASIHVTKPESIVVPNASIVVNDGQTYLFVIENGLALKKNVVTGLKNKDMVEILGGLDQGEKVAVTNVNTLFDQKPVSEQAQ